MSSTLQPVKNYAPHSTGQESHSSGPSTAHRVAVLVFQDCKLLDVAGPTEVFAEANRFGARYEITLCSLGGVDVMTSTGMRIPVDADTAQLGESDTLLVAGGDVYPTHLVDAALSKAAADLADRSGRICSICTGAFVLAAAGLLDGRRATTHWRSAAVLAKRHPLVKVEPDAIFVRDGNVVTSAGVSAGIDLALALVEEDHGAQLARDVARSLVVFMQRPGGQSQFSPSLPLQAPRTPLLRSTMSAVTADPRGDHSLQRLAAAAAVSERHLTRLFREEVGSTPSQYVRQVRFEAAMIALDAGATVDEAAARSGFGSTETMRKTFVARLGIPPQEYRQRFRTTARHRSPLRH